MAENCIYRSTSFQKTKKHLKKAGFLNYLIITCKNVAESPRKSGLPEAYRRND